MVNLPPCITDCDSHSPALLNLFISSLTRICSTIAFPSLGNANHIFVSVFIDFPTNSKLCAQFHPIAYDCSCADQNGKIKLSASAAASEFCEWVQVGIDVYIPHHKYLVKLHSCPWFSAACATAIVHRNYSFCFYQHIKPSESKVKFRQATNVLKRVQTPTKTKESVTSQKRGSWGF